MNQDVLKTLFNPEETMCVSHHKLAYHSISQEEFYSGKITLKSPKDYEVNVKSSDICLLAINPINGWRKDEDVTAYRSFLIELDDIPLPDQIKYIEEMKMPYSLAVFSGGKSIHYVITLDEDIPTYNIWKDVNRWITNILTQADQQNQSPSRSMRFPGAIRKPTGIKQILLRNNGRISRVDLTMWLNNFLDKKPPKPRVMKPKKHISLVALPKFINNILEGLRDGQMEDGRNQSWYKVGRLMSERGISLEDMIEYCENFFIEEPDFKRREWETTLKSAYKGNENVQKHY